MYVVGVTIWVKQGFAEQFLAHTLDNALNTRNEPGNLRFDVSRAIQDDHKFFLYEAYKSEEDFKSHQQTAHYFAWRDAVADWMAQPRQGVKHYSVFPPDDNW